MLTEHQQQSRARHEVLEKQIDELTSQITKDKEALELSRRELLERDLLIRQEKSESQRVQSLLDEVGDPLCRLALFLFMIYSHEDNPPMANGLPSHMTYINPLTPSFETLLTADGGCKRTRRNSVRRHGRTDPKRKRGK